MQSKKLLAFLFSREKTNKLVRKTAKALFFVIALMAVFLFSNHPALAQDTYGLNSFSDSGLATANLMAIIARIINGFLILLGLVAVIIILYAGILWMTASGKEEQVMKAKKTLINGVIGLIIILLSYAFVRLLFGILDLQFQNNEGGPGGGGGGYEPGTGALGAGIIQSHYPTRNAKDVPRNTKIAITFKEPMDLASIISDTNNNNILGDCVDSDDANDTIDVIDANNNGKFDAGDFSECDLINPASIKIRKNADDPAVGPFVDFVKAMVTLDKKTFVLKPVTYLGSAAEKVDYTVSLTSNIKKASGDAAFGSSAGYKWTFEVSTFLDTTPPQVLSVIPKAAANPLEKLYARNVVIQVNFNEAMDPLALSDKLEIEGGGTTGAALKNTSKEIMPIKVGTNYVAGEWYFSNQYRTDEFITNSPCGVNSCGKTIYCLPGLSEITTLLKAATLATAGSAEALEKPDLLSSKGTLYDGLTDMCGNSLNGNKDNTPQGPAGTYNLNSLSGGGDNAIWKFNTNDTVDLIPPLIESRNPDQSEEVSPKADLNLLFSKLLMFNSLVQGSTLTLVQTDDPTAYWFEKNNDDLTDKTTVIIKTNGLKPDGEEYPIIVGSGTKDLYQNCFMPPADTQNCIRVPVAGQPGQYEPSNVSGEWKGTKPNCDLR
ncbi:MAG: TrbC/VirB2 family protein [Candidatus Parcubacteria bacterium]|nr:TrbC/VirB2 family protein [Candidatus Parcubacteria bacterium]